MQDRSRSGDGEPIDTDVCVIGAGPAGLTLARELDAHGVRACLVESGGIEVEKAVQSQSRGQSDGYPIHRLHRCRVRALGGTLRHPKVAACGWAARPLDAVDFEPLPVPNGIGWPFGRADLEPYYARAASTCGIRAPEESTRLWTAQASPRALDFAAGELAPAVFQFTYTALQECWPALSTSRHVRLLLHTRVVDLEVDDSRDRLSRVIAVHAVHGRTRIVVRPRVVVLAAGGIENARLLLLADHCRGLGNEHDLVGRYFADRLSFHAGHIELRQPELLSELAIFHRPPGIAIGGGLRVADRAQRERGLPNCVFFLQSRPATVSTDGLQALSTVRKMMGRRPVADGLDRQLRRLPSASLPLADFALGRVVARPRALVVRAQGEPCPDRESRIRLGPGRDDLGLPVARVTWRIASGDHEFLRASAAVLDAALRERGLGSLRWSARLEDGTTLVEGNHHHLGATRMHPDPERGVVDADGRVHSVGNLYVTGSSVFPRYGASNPTLTIIALAHRLADHLRAALSQPRAVAGPLGVSLGHDAGRGRRMR
jgi:choline dehydrogenase-like flavoprotein